MAEAEQRPVAGAREQGKRAGQEVTGVGGEGAYGPSWLLVLVSHAGEALENLKEESIVIQSVILEDHSVLCELYCRTVRREAEMPQGEEKGCGLGTAGRTGVGKVGKGHPLGGGS